MSVLAFLTDHYDKVPVDDPVTSSCLDKTCPILLFFACVLNTGETSTDILTASIENSHIIDYK